MTVIHSFDERLAYSHAQADQPWWDLIYRQAFPDMVASADLRHDGWHQRAGRDRAIVLSSGRTIYVDEKVRSEHYEDVLVEVWSVYPNNGGAPYAPVAGAELGWARKVLDCDWLAYAFEPSQTCHLFPFLGLRAAFERQRLGWIEQATQRINGFRWVLAPNGRYKTVSIAVPTAVLGSAIANAMTVSWGLSGR